MEDELQRIPGIGAKMAAYLHAQGIHHIADLRGKDPEEIYAKDCAAKGILVDRCALYVWRLAVYYAEHNQWEEEKLRWWYWKDHVYPEETE
ncbi:MAG TPA: helix-hairpin-helix domain-containing protein [Candidatus Anaerotignum merdipullorum]|nr:helix-hairpin-helix domain-containing protein [Candidatus Anaerotignum merdipullorum]